MSTADLFRLLTPRMWNSLPDDVRRFRPVSLSIGCLNVFSSSRFLTLYSGRFVCPYCDTCDSFFTIWATCKNVPIRLYTFTCFCESFAIESSQQHFLPAVAYVDTFMLSISTSSALISASSSSFHIEMSDTRSSKTTRSTECMQN